MLRIRTPITPWDCSNPGTLQRVSLQPVELKLDLTDLAAELQLMAELLEAVEEERDLADFPAGPIERISKPLTES